MVLLQREFDKVLTGLGLADGRGADSNLLEAAKRAQGVPTVGLASPKRTIGRRINNGNGIIATRTSAKSKGGGGFGTGSSPGTETTEASSGVVSQEEERGILPPILPIRPALRSPLYNTYRGPVTALVRTVGADLRPMADNFWR